MTTREPLPDYAPVIRAQIEREVVSLKRAMEVEGAYIEPEQWPLDDVIAQYVEVGHLIALHHGRPVVQEGDTLAGLPVRFNSHHPRTISVCADKVEFETDEDEEGLTDTFEKDLAKETTW